MSREIEKAVRDEFYAKFPNEDPTLSTDAMAKKLIEYEEWQVRQHAKVSGRIYAKVKFYEEVKNLKSLYNAELVAWPYGMSERPFVVAIDTYGDYCLVS